MTSLDELDEEQRKAFEQIEAETQPVFVTGPAGTGKSTLLRALRDNSRDSLHTLVVAFTGVAALNVEGMTIHSLALRTSIGDYEINVYRPLNAGRELSRRNLDLATNAKLLIIDEVSMARADLIDALDRFFRLAKDSAEPFGGIRVVMFGDLRQLPPFVIRERLYPKERKFLQGYENAHTPHFFCAHVISLTGIKTIELSEIKRQSDPVFVENLNELRGGNPDSSVIEYFNANTRGQSSGDAVRLFAENIPAKAFNKRKLSSINAESKVYRSFTNLETMALEATLGKVQKNPAPEYLELKVGAKIMVLRNLDIELGLVNGAIGIVESLGADHIGIRLDRDGSHHSIKRSTWDIFGPQLETIRLESGDVEQVIVRKKIGEFVQFPLILAWAVTIHKAQGQTLDEARIDFNADFRSPGQAYVAVSRLRSIDGLSFRGEMSRSHVKPFDRVMEAFLANPNKPARFSVARDDRTLWNVEHARLLRNVMKLCQRLLPWVDFLGLENALLSEALVPQVVDRSGFDLIPRLRYLHEQFGISALDYLIYEYAINPKDFEILLINIDRSMRNRVQLIDIGDWTEITSDEVFLRRELEVTGLEFSRFRRALGRKGAIDFLKEHHVGKVEHGVERLKALGLEDAIASQVYLGF